MNELEKLTEVDWHGLVLLIGQYRSIPYVAGLVKCNWQHLGRIGRGETAQPRFNTGVRLLKYASEILSEEELKQVIPLT